MEQGLDDASGGSAAFWKGVGLAAGTGGLQTLVVVSLPLNFCFFKRRWSLSMGSGVSSLFGKLPRRFVDDETR